MRWGNSSSSASKIESKSVKHYGIGTIGKTQDNDPIDLVAVHRVTGRVIKIDVKTASYRKTWKPGTMINRKESKYQKQLGVKILYVLRDGECKWKK